MWSELERHYQSREPIPDQLVRWAMNQILDGQASEAEIKAFLLGLKSIGESESDVLALVDVMYQHCLPISIGDRAVDCVGTGGDGFNTINISTAAAIVTTAAGARVIKHGNRSASSKSGSADVLEALGININLKAEGVGECVRKIGIGFAFAPNFHPAMRFAAPARKALGQPTIFNILGPLANPARPKAVAIGVARSEFLPIVAGVLARRNCEGFVFRGAEGLDEISISTATTILQISEGKIREEILDITELGIPTYSIADLRGGEASENADRIRKVFNGAQGADREAILLNAAAALAAFKGDFELGISEQLANGYAWAKSAIDSGKATQLLERWSELSNELANRSL